MQHFGLLLGMLKAFLALKNKTVHYPVRKIIYCVAECNGRKLHEHMNRLFQSNQK